LKIKDHIILLIGKSGTGKTTIQNALLKKYDLKPVISYSTRAPRYDGEDSHIFVSEAEYEQMKDDMCAFTEFDGNKYWATNKQVDECDVYIIDPAGVEYFKKHYKGKKKIIIIELLAQRKVRYKRMRKRGDSILSALRRLHHDKKVFANTNAMVTINANINNVDLITTRVYDSATFVVFSKLGAVSYER